MNRDFRALVVGTGVIAMGWIALRGVPEAVGDVRRKEESVQQRAELLARARLRVESLRQLEDSVRALDSVAEALPEMLLVGEDEQTASVDLMRRLRERLASRPASLLGFEPLPVNVQSPPLELAAIKAQVETDYRELLAIVSEIELDPAMAIESLDIVAPDPDADTAASQRLSAGLGVSGWYRPTVERADTLSEAFPR